MTNSRLTLKEISLFFFPLLLNVQLMSASHSVINAFLARLQAPVVALAAFSAAMVLHLFVASPSYQNHTICIALVRGRKSLLGTGLFVLAIASYVSAMLGLIGYTHLGDLVLLRLLGLSAPVAAATREVVQILAFLPFLTGLRGLFQGLVIRARRTGLVSLATLIRIGALCLMLWLGSRWLNGPALGAFGLVACIGVETLCMGLFALRWRLPAEPVAEKSVGEIFRFGLPLAFSSAMQQAIPLCICAIIGRLPDGELALAAFGLIRGFLFLLAGPMRNLQQAYLTLVREAGDYQVLVRFFRRTSCGMGLLMLLVAYPLSGPVLGGLIGLDQPMRRYLALPLAACALHPYLYGVANLLRGFFTGAHRTSLLGRSTVVKLLFLLLIWGLLELLPFSLPGVAVAIFLLLACELCEAGYLKLHKGRLPLQQSIPLHS